MTQFMASRFWNASSSYGQLDGLEEVIESAKSAIRALTGAEPDDEIVFTSGATESNVWAIAEGVRRARDRGWILSSEIEHPSVLEPIQQFQKKGGVVNRVPITNHGTIDVDKLDDLINDDLRFASLILAHNETGVIQPLGEAATRIRNRAPQCLIHTDATQAIGKMPMYLANEMSDVDLISFSGHKFYGPKGIGGLIIRNRAIVRPFILGGGHQNNLRSGTLNVPAIAGISIAGEKCLSLLQNNSHSRVEAIRNYFEDIIISIFPNVYFVGSKSTRLPNTSFFGIPGIDAEDLVNALAAQGIVISKGSSCSSLSIQPSKAALLMGYSYEEASSLMRFSSSIYSTTEEVSEFVETLAKII